MGIGPDSSPECWAQHYHRPRLSIVCALAGPRHDQGSQKRCLTGRRALTCPLCAVSFLCQWNSHGYDIAKVFGSKFTHISPVWLQLKRRGREMFEVTGLHDVDQGLHTACLPVLIPGMRRVRVSLCVSGHA